MPRLPFFGFPYQYPYNNYYKNPIHNINKNNSINSSSIISESDKKNNKKQAKYRQPFSFNFDGVSDNSKPVAELLGINLYIDDIIILCLLFVLYKEEVKDEMLFICLLLLLIT